MMRLKSPEKGFEGSAIGENFPYSEHIPKSVRDIGGFVVDAAQKFGDVIVDGLGVTVGIESFQKTRDQEWPELDKKARIGAIGVGVVSVSRLFYETYRTINSQRSWGRTFLDTAAAISDGVDGGIARETGGETTFGAWLDQFIGDKLPKILREISLVMNSDLSLLNLFIRTSRDIAVTYSRSRTIKETEGQADVAALPKKNWLSGKWSTFNVFTTNILLASPLGEKLPKTLKNLIAGQATAHLVASGIQTWKQNRAQVQAIKNQPQN